MGSAAELVGAERVGIRCHFLSAADTSRGQQYRAAIRAQAAPIGRGETLVSPSGAWEWASVPVAHPCAGGARPDGEREYCAHDWMQARQRGPFREGPPGHRERRAAVNG
jgi:hypothetical protein